MKKGIAPLIIEANKRLGDESDITKEFLFSHSFYEIYWDLKKLGADVDSRYMSEVFYSIRPRCEYNITQCLNEGDMIKDGTYRLFGSILVPRHMIEETKLMGKVFAPEHEVYLCWSSKDEE